MKPWIFDEIFVWDVWRVWVVFAMYTKLSIRCLPIPSENFRLGIPRSSPRPWCMPWWKMTIAWFSCRLLFIHQKAQSVLTHSQFSLSSFWIKWIIVSTYISGCGLSLTPYLHVHSILFIHIILRIEAEPHSSHIACSHFGITTETARSISNSLDSIYCWELLLCRSHTGPGWLMKRMQLTMKRHTRMIA